MPAPSLAGLKKELAAAADPGRARNSAWFFKTGEGQYGHGDRFIGLTVPTMRRIAHRYIHLPQADVGKLLASPIHEHRFVALEILVAQYEQGDTRAIFDFYQKHTKFVNNWDLVDTSAPYIVGAHLFTRPRKILYRLAKSSNLWERRIAIVSTLALIRPAKSRTRSPSPRLLPDEHDLIHEAVGWMLREAGKQSAPALVRFLKEHYSEMPRTALRYAIERFLGGRKECSPASASSSTRCNSVRREFRAPSTFRDKKDRRPIPTNRPYRC